MATGSFQGRQKAENFGKYQNHTFELSGRFSEKTVTRKIVKIERTSAGSRFLQPAAASRQIFKD
ncbi:hypothetical protein [Methanosarcina siciliae]|uniref:hypothetical protein n=1 Tax=Methanosarcina siciliae TaxID=38027 RepID=UPI00064F6484|nr:hypothetical protein [Methanosarcina siciliae]